MSDRDYRQLQLVAAAGGGELRTADFNGSTHLVVPVVAMVEGVVWAVNSEYPELVTAEELAVSPQQWNGRGCFAGHPDDGKTQVTANTPRVLETSFGVIFGAPSPERILSTRRLELEAYLDPDKAIKVGPKAEDVIRRLRAGETIEVSVGCYVVSEKVEGVWGDKPFVGKWTDIVSDHLAFLAEDEVGACSVEAGCGAARSAVRHLITAKGIEAMPATSTPPKTTPTPPVSAPPKGAPATTPGKRNWMERMMSLFQANEGTSDVDLRRSLDKALSNSVIGYMGIVEVTPDDGVVIYEARQDETWTAFRQKYTMDGADVTLNGKPKRVEQQSSWVEVKAAEERGACGCGAAPKNATSEQETNVMNDKTKAFVAKSNGKFTEADTWLENVPEDKLDSLLTSPVAAAPAAAAASAVVPAPAAPAAVADPEAEYLKNAPQSIRDIVEGHKAFQAAKRTEMVTFLKTAQKVYTEQELNDMPFAQLEKLDQLVDSSAQETPAAASEHIMIRDYSGAGAPKAAAAAGAKDVYRNPPKPYELALAKQRATVQ